MDRQLHRPIKAVLGILCCCLCFACLLGGSQVQAKSFTLALVGDLMLGRGVAAAHQQDGWSGTFSFISNELRSVDLALGNLESPLGTNDNTLSAVKGFNLCADPSTAEILVEVGFDALSTANNHRSDCENGHSGSTEDALTGAGILVINENNNPLELTINGIKLALLAYDDISAAIDLEDALETIQKASTRNDLVIVSMHWGHGISKRRHTAPERTGIPHVPGRCRSDLGTSPACITTRGMDQEGDGKCNDFRRL